MRKKIPITVYIEFEVLADMKYINKQIHKK